MNFSLLQIPERTVQPRSFGLTMVSDKGLSAEEAKDFLSVCSPHVDMVKLAFGTSLVTFNIQEKLKVYKSFNVPVFLGGLLFEAFVIRNQFDDYIRLVKDYEINCIEVSDGAITISREEKC